jgi:hypothetical protein
MLELACETGELQAVSDWIKAMSECKIVDFKTLLTRSKVVQAQ